MIRRSEDLQEIIDSGDNYGYDIEVFIGMKRFIDKCQREEIRDILRVDHGIQISSGEVSNLARRFVSHLEELHQISTEKIKQALAEDGGYPLHIDATGECRQAGARFCGLCRMEQMGAGGVEDSDGTT